MDPAPISVHIAGTTYKLHASAPEEQMTKLAAVVEAKIRELNPRSRPVTASMFVLVALALANDAAEEREKRTQTEREARDIMRRMVARIDLALEEDDAPEADEHESPEP